MTEELQLPRPAPKGVEQEKWRAMVDSVIEFITASKTMLHVLNERLVNAEKFKEEEKMRMDEEEEKLKFYKDCLHLELKQKQESKAITTEVDEECGDSSCKAQLDIKCPVHGKRCIKDFGDKVCEKSNSVSDSIKPTQKPLENEPTKKDQLKEDTVNPTISHGHVPNCSRCLSPIREISATTVVSTQAPKCQNEETIIRCRKVLSAGNNEDVDDSSPISKPTPCCTNQGTNITCKKILAQEMSKKQLVTNTFITEKKSCCNTECKNQKLSRIPRTRSFNDDRNKNVASEHGEESTARRTPCYKKCHKESNYSSIHHRNKSLSSVF